MSVIRRTGALAVAVVVMGAFSAVPASADPLDTFVGTAAGRALHLTLLGQESTLGVSNATVKSALSAVSGAAGQLLNLATTTAASVTQDDAAVVDPADGTEKCGPLSLPAAASALLSASTACSSSKAAILKGVPTSLGQGFVAGLDLNANNLLKSLNASIPLGSTLTGLLAPVLGLISQPGGAPTVLNPTDTITDLLNALTTTKTLAIRLGKSTSELATTDAAVTSTATAAGGQIDLLPIAALDNTPLASIIIGSAKAVASQNRTGGLGTASFDPSLVTVKIGALGGLPGATIPVRPGQTITILQGTPLESTITLADGKTENVKGSSKAVADGVSIQLLKGLSLGGLVPLGGLTSSGVSAAAAPSSGGIGLELAHAEVAVVSSPAPPPPPPAAPKVEAARQLPFTGNPPWLLFGGALLVGAAYVTRRVVRIAADRIS